MKREQRRQRNNDGVEGKGAINDGDNNNRSDEHDHDCDVTDANDGNDATTPMLYNCCFYSREGYLW